MSRNRAGNQLCDIAGEKAADFGQRIQIDFGNATLQLADVSHGYKQRFRHVFLRFSRSSPFGFDAGADTFVVYAHGCVLLYLLSLMANRYSLHTVIGIYLSFTIDFCWQAGIIKKSEDDGMHHQL